MTGDKTRETLQKLQWKVRTANEVGVKGWPETQLRRLLSLKLPGVSGPNEVVSSLVGSHGVHDPFGFSFRLGLKENEYRLFLERGHGQRKRL